MVERSEDIQDTPAEFCNAKVKERKDNVQEIQQMCVSGTTDTMDNGAQQEGTTEAKQLSCDKANTGNASTADSNSLREKLEAKTGWDAADETNQFQSYMTEKNRKLRDQYDKERQAMQKTKRSSDTQVNKAATGSSQLFAGVTVWVNGHTKPCRLEIRRLMMQHGGKFETYYNSRVTHIVADRLAVATLKRYQSVKYAVKLVTATWVSTCIEKSTRVEEWRFPIPGMSSKGQSSIAKMLTAAPKTKFKPDGKNRACCSKNWMKK